MYLNDRSIRSALIKQGVIMNYQKRQAARYLCGKGYTDAEIADAIGLPLRRKHILRRVIQPESDWKRHLKIKARKESVDD